MNHQLRIGDLGKAGGSVGDADSADLFSPISRGSDAQLWFPEVHPLAA